MGKKLEGKIAVVTGGSAGIGLGIAKAFAADGAHVFVTGRRQEELDKAVDEIGSGAVGIKADASDEPISHDGRVMGLGCGTIRFIGDLDTLIAIGTTPVSTERTHIRMVVLGNRERMRAAGLEDRFEDYADVQAELLTQDFDIWEHKKYRAEPKLCHRDGPIGRYRQWASQFYA
jgi:NAD(P)-dependent dehydrogenase (short-subunit alcohol dehydrogenase family)